MDKREPRNFTVEKPGQHRLSQVIRVNISRLVESMYFDSVIGMAFTSVVFLPKTPTLCLNMTKPQVNPV